MSVTITIETDTSSIAQLTALADTAGRRKYLTAVSRTAANVFTSNFEQKARARHRGGPFNYYLTAARNTSADTDQDSAIIRITAPAGIALRRYGGTVLPSGRISRVTGRPITKLAIPARDGPAAGRTTLDMQTAGVKLRLIVIKRLNLAALAGEDTSSGRPRIYFWLVPKTTHQPDPTVFPDNETLGTAVNKTLARVFKSAITNGSSNVN